MKIFSLILLAMLLTACSSLSTLVSPQAERTLCDAMRNVDPFNPSECIVEWAVPRPSS